MPEISTHKSTDKVNSGSLDQEYAEKIQSNENSSSVLGDDISQRNNTANAPSKIINLTSEETIRSSELQNKYSVANRENDAKFHKNKTAAFSDNVEENKSFDSKIDNSNSSTNYNFENLTNHESKNFSGNSAHEFRSNIDSPSEVNVSNETKNLPATANDTELTTNFVSKHVTQAQSTTKNPFTEHFNTGHTIDDGCTSTHHPLCALSTKYRCPNASPCESVECSAGEVINIFNLNGYSYCCCDVCKYACR